MGNEASTAAAYAPRDEPSLSSGDLLNSSGEGAEAGGGEKAEEMVGGGGPKSTCSQSPISARSGGGDGPRALPVSGGFAALMKAKAAHDEAKSLQA